MLQLRLALLKSTEATEQAQAIAKRTREQGMELCRHVAEVESNAAIREITALRSQQAELRVQSHEEMQDAMVVVRREVIQHLRVREGQLSLSEEGVYREMTDACRTAVQRERAALQ